MAQDKGAKNTYGQWLKLEPHFKDHDWVHGDVRDEVECIMAATNGMRVVVASNTLLTALFQPLAAVDDAARAKIVDDVVRARVDPMQVKLDPKLEMVARPPPTLA